MRYSHHETYLLFVRSFVDTLCHEYYSKSFNLTFNPNNPKGDIVLSKIFFNKIFIARY